MEAVLSLIGTIAAAVIGGIFLLLQARMNRKQDDTERQLEKPPARYSRVAWIFGAGAAVLMLLTLALFFIGNSRGEANEDDEGIAILEPKSRVSVPCVMVAEGTYDPQRIEGVIWPVVLFRGRYYPQDQNGVAPLSNDGLWSGEVRFGECDKNHGDEMQLLLVTTDAETNAAFEQFAREVMANPQREGLDKLPDGADIRTRVVVKRKE